jgi:hypothetical protein
MHPNTPSDITQEQHLYISRHLLDYASAVRGEAGRAHAEVVVYLVQLLLVGGQLIGLALEGRKHDVRGIARAEHDGALRIKISRERE